MLQPVPTAVLTVVFSLVVISFWLWMFVAMIQNDELDANAKTYWTLGFIFLSIAAAALYYVNIYRQRT
jgi:hypothetical protein